MAERSRCTIEYSVDNMSPPHRGDVAHCSWCRWFWRGRQSRIECRDLAWPLRPRHPCVSAEGGEDDRPSRVGNISAGNDGAPLYFNRNSVLTAAPLLNAEGPGSSSPGWRTPPCGSCVPHSTGTWGLRAPPQRLAHW